MTRLPLPAGDWGSPVRSSSRGGSDRGLSAPGGQVRWLAGGAALGALQSGIPFQDALCGDCTKVAGHRATFFSPTGGKFGPKARCSMRSPFLPLAPSTHCFERRPPSRPILKGSRSVTTSHDGRVVCGGFLWSSVLGHTIPYVARLGGCSPFQGIDDQHVAAS